MNEAGSTAGGTAAGTPGDGAAEPRQRGGTRARIQQVAVQLFTEQGYDKTSLREIAERLDVTKAALYYHFKSKEDIVRSLAEDYFSELDSLISWGRGQPASVQARREILRRYVRIVAGGDKVFRMLQQNQAAVHSLAAAKSRGELFRERLTSLIELLAGPEGDQASKLRAAMALGGISVGWMYFAGGDGEGLTETMAALAAEIVEARPGTAPDADRTGP